jgi:protein-disulfide isomerase
MFKSINKIALTLSCALTCLFTYNSYASDSTTTILEMPTTAGSQDADVRITEVFSYTCGDCHEWTKNQEYNLVKQKLIQLKKASFRQFHFPFNEQDTVLGVAHRCYVLSYYEHMLGEQSRIDFFNQSLSTFFTLNPILKEFNYNHKKYNACLYNVNLEDYRSKQRKKAEKYNINRTPSFMIEKKCEHGYCSVSEKVFNTKEIMLELEKLKSQGE